MAAPAEPYYVTDLARMLGYSVAWTRRKLASGQIPGMFRLSEHAEMRVDRGVFDAWYAAQVRAVDGSGMHTCTQTDTGH